MRGASCALDAWSGVTASNGPNSKNMAWGFSLAKETWLLDVPYQIRSAAKVGAAPRICQRVLAFSPENNLSGLQFWRAIGSQPPVG
jgi:hypothetical protein